MGPGHLLPARRPLKLRGASPCTPDGPRAASCSRSTCVSRCTAPAGAPLRPPRGPSSGWQTSRCSGSPTWQRDATSNNRENICEPDLSAAIVAQLGGLTKCEEVIKNQLAQIDNLHVEDRVDQHGPRRQDGHRQGKEQLRRHQPRKNPQAGQGRQRVEDLRGSRRGRGSASGRARTGARSTRGTRPSGSAPTTTRCRDTTRRSAPGPRSKRVRGSQPSARTLSELSE